MPPAYDNANDFPHKGWLNIAEASELTGYSKQLVWKAIRNKELYGVKRIWWYGLIRRHAWFIKPDDLMRWVGWRSSNRALTQLARSTK